MNQNPERLPVRISSPGGLIAVVPHLLGFTPQASLVVIGVSPQRGRVKLTFRYDLPDTNDPAEATAIAEHAFGMLAQHRIAIAVVIGYGPGPLVTPLTDAVREASSGTGVSLRDVLRVQDGRYWSYICRDPSCCPADGVPLDATDDLAVQAMTAAGAQVLPDREALTATLAPVTGPDAEAMARATRRALRVAVRLLRTEGTRALDREGLSAVQAVIAAYRNGQTISPRRNAWLSVVLTRLPVRDDAWARMDPAHRNAHIRLWSDLVRQAQPGYVAAPASLLAFTAWQSGRGALANIAVDRALADIPGYSMVELIREAVNSGLPPSAARLPMTPEEVAASYAHQIGD
jgi:Domain of unknown function (DUF4192)